MSDGAGESNSVAKSVLKLFNLLVLAGAVGLFVTYVIVFTTWWELVGGIFTVSGAFVWLAFLANLLTEDTKKTLRKGFEAVFLNRPLSFLIPVVVLGVLFLLVPAQNGTLIFDGLENDEPRVVTVRADADGAEAKLPLSPRAEAKLLQATDFLGTRRYTVEVSGLPRTEVELAWFERKRIAVPDDFLKRPVVLLRPHVALAETAADPGFRFALFHNKELVALDQPFRGRAVWLGAGPDVEPPARLRQQWRSAFAAAKKPVTFLALWESPIAAKLSGLAPGDRIYARLSWPNGDQGDIPLAVACGTVVKPKSPDDFPQELELEPFSPGKCADFAP